MRFWGDGHPFFHPYAIHFESSRHVVAPLEGSQDKRELIETLSKEKEEVEARLEAAFPLPPTFFFVRTF